MRGVAERPLRRVDRLAGRRTGLISESVGGKSPAVTAMQLQALPPRRTGQREKRVHTVGWIRRGSRWKLGSLFNGR